jgi:hypothetical protein
MKKILKIVGIVIAAIIVIPLLVALFVNKNYGVEREIVINQPKQMVFDYVVLLKNQNKFSVWAKIDPNMKTSFKGTDGAVGFISSWESENKNAGKGEQEIKKITGTDRIDYEIRFKEPYESTDNAYLTLTAVSENQTKVKWGFKGRMGYPMNLFLLFMNMEKMLGGDLENGLINLRNILESK